MIVKSGYRSVANAVLNREVNGSYTEAFFVEPPFFTGVPTIMAAIAGIDMHTSRDNTAGSHRHNLEVHLDKPVFDKASGEIQITIHKNKGVVIQSVTIAWIAISA